MFQGPKGYITQICDVKYTCSVETVQQNGRFTLFSNKLPSNIYSTLFVYNRQFINIDRQSGERTRGGGKLISLPYKY